MLYIIRASSLGYGMKEPMTTCAAMTRFQELSQAPGMDVGVVTLL